jgi:hypothetical protein
MTRWWHASDQELLTALGRTQQAVNAAHRTMLELVAEVVRRGVGARAGFRSEVELLHLTQNITKTAARARIDAATDVLPARTLSGQELPATAAAVAADAISAEHVTAIRAVLAALPPHLERERPGLEADLAGWAGSSIPGRSANSADAPCNYSIPTGPARATPTPPAPGSRSPPTVPVTRWPGGSTGKPTPR